MKTTLIKNDLNEYLQQIKRLLSCSANSKRKLIFELENNINEYRIDNPNSTITDIIEQFGTPEYISSYYLSTLDEKELNEKLKKAKIIRRVVIGVGAAIVLIFIALCLCELIHNNQMSKRDVEVGLTRDVTISSALK